MSDLPHDDEKQQQELQTDLERQAKRDPAQREHMEQVAEIDHQIRLVRDESSSRMRLVTILSTVDHIIYP
jgi:hypothetical protein